MELNIEQLRSWIGREETRHELVTPSLVERFNATFDHEGDTANDAVAPLLIHLCLTQPAALTSRLGPDGHPARGGFRRPCLCRAVCGLAALLPFAMISGWATS